MNEETKNKFEQNFTDFLVEKINRTGGALQFQYLFGCLPQELGFEVRNAFGKTKADVMKFLRGHPKTFKVDQKGIVTLITSAVEEDRYDSDESQEDKKQIKKKLPPKIEKGEGTIEKISAKYAIIRAIRPIETFVYFTPHEYGAKNDCLFIDLDLEIRCNVFFNAVYGLNQYEIEYRATKVWRELDASFRNDMGIKTIRNYPENETDSKERRNHANDPSVCSEKNRKDIVNKDVIENEPGKIYPYRNGAIIKFGKDYAERADAKSSRFYLLGCEIFEMIDMEFSEGDDIMFDGTKIDGKDWKAVLVWSGEKPNVKINTKVVNERRSRVREVSKSPPPPKRPVSKASSKNYDEPAQYKEKKSLSQKKENNVVMKKNIPLDRPSTNTKRYHGTDRPESSQVSRSSHGRSPHKRSKNRTRSSVSKKDNFCAASKNKDNRQKNIPEYKKKSSFKFNNDGSHRFSSRESVSDMTFDSNQDTSDDDRREIQASSQKRNRKFLQECGSPENESDCKLTDSDGEENKIVSSSSESNINKCASIKKFYQIKGNIVKLYCKFAIVASRQTPEGLDFVLSAFFIDGKSVEEQNVIDLKEVIKVGDSIKFNYFQIVDDKGDVYHKVTAAWIGPQPEIEETTPEEYIRECDLSVSVNCEFDNECREEEAMQQCSTVSSTQSENTPEFLSPSDSPVFGEMSEEKDDLLDYSSSDSKTENNAYDIDDSSSDIPSSSLSEKIMERLRIHGCVSLNSKVFLFIY